MATKALKRPLPSLSGFVNLKGEGLIPDGPSFQRTRASTPARKPATIGREDQGPTGHHGWMPCGFSPERLRQAEAEHEADQDNAKAKHLKERRPGEFIRKAWDADVYMANARPQTARPTPYAIPSAAKQCAELLTKAGWLRVAVHEITK